ncbi:ABC-type glycerol-3-phosphate transport system, substrate-binding protein [Butyrivibrio fibrisolvens DSM 3071]|uniref:ABC-type glycerol-3-phosphate transport system, substrate-binding protein n=1 Tax=Butyrivibrio fibrisolvens DSM 3071 TaxID=1121131 RepID=A0A1M6F6Y6_BUTFI|nr:extracellular solute-binding protein [Butyrivibrio fibrisolvens]SHI93465.1 ABC-type glycerol-3-phosphate transport system, substrate-binding protein [Butyrivibrio fibrisolvens DSM 3071]
MKSWKKGLAIGAVAVLAIVGIAALFLTKRVENFRDKYEGVDLTQEVEGMERTGGYTGYLLEHEGVKDSEKDIDIDLSAYEAEGDVKFEASYEGESNVLYTDLNSKVTFKVNAPEEGFYNLYLEYYLPESRGVAAERAVYINGELPFDDAINISFSRVWVDGGDKRVDNQGNEIRPKQVEEYCWQSAYFRDKLGYIAEPYKFYLNKGENEVMIEAVNEPMAIKNLKFTSVFELATYEEYTAANSSNSANQSEGYTQIVQGEESARRSESSLYAKYDRSSPSTQPMSLKHTVLNYVGGEAWSTNGQWIEWDVTVEEDGFYNLTVKGRQNYSRGNVSNRTLYIDGEIPFKEVEEISFPYTNNWDLITLSDENGNPYNFYLTKGTHTIRLEASLGELGTILEEIEDSTYRLNQIYRKILVYTGASPDQYRDYHVETTYPEVMKAMELESKRLYKIVDDMVDYSGQKADSIATAQTIAQQLERFCEKPNKITTEFTTFKDNITSLGTSTLNLSMTKLDIDYIEVTAAGTAPKKDTESALDRIGHEIKSFVISFFVDYNAVGDVYGDGDDVVKVWVLTGRDQGTILKSMIDEDFTTSTGIKVNVEIVDAGALQSAVIAGRGPNVVLSIGADQPVNYALRGAAEDITQFPDYQEVLANYSESSYEQISLDGHIYGIPETQTFNVMFYRKDVMEELGLEIPNTWDELIAEMPTIQGKNLSVGIPSAAGSSSSAQATTTIMSASADLSMYFSLLFQYGGDVYNEAGNKTTVDTEAGIKAFEDYVRYFNDYGIPTVYDFVSRFRSGEMPIGIAPYSTYNTLMVSAPEIRGLWDFTLIPGTVRTNEDGTTYIDRSDFISGAATMMIKTEDEQLRQMSWEFMKWWAQPETQVTFGREIEALLGASARYATANREAFSNLSWSADDIEVLNAQWDQTRGIREVPGGYYTGRHISNAIRKVFNEKVDSRETIIDYSIKIDDELTKKRKEFGLPVYGE